MIAKDALRLLLFPLRAVAFALIVILLITIALSTLLLSVLLMIVYALAYVTMAKNSRVRASLRPWRSPAQFRSGS